MKQPLHIFPNPKVARIRKTEVSLHNAEWVVIPPSASRALRERIQELIEKAESVLMRPLRMSNAVPASGNVMIAISLDSALPGQHYKLELSKQQKMILAGDEAGAYYGVLTWLQILEQYGEAPLSLTIEDGPDFPSRGVMLDVSRCKVPTMETCKTLIQRLSSLRMNQLQLYTEHTFSFSAHQPVWYDASPFTHEEILELDQYCSDHFVELVPNLNSFGHFERWLRHPEYKHLAECPDLENPGTLAPNNASLALLESLYDEYLPLFSSAKFNVGCDETWELGKGRSKKRAEKTSTTEVYLDFIKKIHKRVKKRGKQMQFWGDIILHQPELIKELPSDILALCWGYEAEHPYQSECKAFADSAIEFYVCPGTSAWNSITGRTDNCLKNLENAAVNGKKNGATGFLITDWGDGGHHQVLPISYLGFTAGAAYSWNFKANCKANIAAAISKFFFGENQDTLGQLCLDIGRTLEYIPGLVRANCSVFGRLFFRNLSKLDLSGITKSQYQIAEKWLQHCEEQLTDASPNCDDSKLVMQEFRHTLAMAQFAIHRAKKYQYQIGDEDVLRSDLQSIVLGHEEQWLARNRRGGLRESSGLLRRVLDEGCYAS